MAWRLWSRSAFKYMSVCVRHKCLVRLLTSDCSSTGILKGVGAVYSTGKVLIGCVQCAQRRTAAEITRNDSFLHSLSYKEFIQQVTEHLILIPPSSLSLHLQEPCERLVSSPSSASSCSSWVACVQLPASSTSPATISSSVQESSLCLQVRLWNE